MTEGSAESFDPLQVATLFGDIGVTLMARADAPSTLTAITEVAVERVPGAAWASVTRGLDRSFTTMAASGETALVADRLQYDQGTGPCVDAVVNNAVFVSQDL